MVQFAENVNPERRTMRTNQFKMSEFFACNAAIRPPYCKQTTNVCCFNCEYQAECMMHSAHHGIIKPCDWKIFDQEEICEFAV